MAHNGAERTPETRETETSSNFAECLVCNSMVFLSKNTTDIIVCDNCKSNHLLKSAKTKLVFVDVLDNHGEVKYIESISEEKPPDDVHSRAWPESSELKFNHESKENNFQCDKCMATFRQIQHLKHHVMATHQCVTPFACPHCPKRFARRPNYKLHLKVHSEPEYQCDICDRKYKLQQSLKLHIRMCHEHDDSGLQMRHETKERKFTCEECGKKLCYLVTYTRHMENHARAQKHKGQDRT